MTPVKLATLRRATARCLMSARRDMQAGDPQGIFHAGGWDHMAWKSAFDTQDQHTMGQYDAIHHALIKRTWKQREAVNV